MMTLAARYAPRQEIYSIDECFLDFDGVPGDLVAIGRALRAQVLTWTGLPTSIGFGATKTLAKLANHVAKTADRKPGRYVPQHAQVCSFLDLSAASMHAVLGATDVENVWGIGRKTTLKLNEAGLRSVQDLLEADVPTLRRQFGVGLEKTLRELRGTPCHDVDDAPPPNQQIMCSRSFGAPVTDLPTLIEVVSQFTTQVARKLREQGSLAGAVQVFIATSPHRRQDRQHAPSATLPLSTPSSDTRALINAAVRALCGIFRPGCNYAKAGVVLVDLQPASHEQAGLDLFEATPRLEAPGRNRASLMSAMDALNQRFGRDAVTVASASGRPGPSAHASKQERRSPRCTTRLDEIAVARA